MLGKVRAKAKRFTANLAHKRLVGVGVLVVRLEHLQRLERLMTLRTVVQSAVVVVVAAAAAINVVVVVVVHEGTVIAH